MNNIVNFKFGTITKYNNLTQKDNDTIYFADGQIFKGNQAYSQKIEIVSSLPETPSQGIIYILPDYSAKFYTGTDYVDIAVGVIGEIADATDNDALVVTQAAVKAYITKKLEGMETAEALQAEIDKAKDEAIATATATAADDATNKVDAAKAELQQQIDAKVASVFKFKGSKDSLKEIEELEDMIVGDVWHVSADGKEYVYTGTEWELLGFTIDLSAYATKEEVTKEINDKFTELAKKLDDYYTKTEIDSQVAALNQSIATAKQEAIETASADAQTKADKALSDAKSYSDVLNSAMSDRVKVTENALTWATIE